MMYLQLLFYPCPLRFYYSNTIFSFTIIINNIQNFVCKFYICNFYNTIFFCCVAKDINTTIPNCRFVNNTCT